MDTGFSCFQISFKHSDTRSIHKRTPLTRRFLCHSSGTNGIAYSFFTYRNDSSLAAFDALFVACYREDLRGNSLLEAFSFVKLEFAFLRDDSDGLPEGSPTPRRDNRSKDRTMAILYFPWTLDAARLPRDNPMKMDRVTAMLVLSVQGKARTREPRFSDVSRFIGTLLSSLLIFAREN